MQFISQALIFKTDSDFSKREKMLPSDVIGKIQNNVSKPCFWKSLSPGGNWKSKSMRIIPEEFVRSTSGAFEHRVVVTTRWDNSWQFWLEREKNDLVMIEEDWDDFVDYNNLGSDDNLFFRHDDSMFLEVQIIKNDGDEIGYVPLETEPETDSIHHKHLNSYKETTSAPASDCEFSANGGTDSRARQGCEDFKNPERYLMNPENAHFVKTIYKKNTVLIVPNAIIKKYDLKFGPHNSSMKYILPKKTMKGLTKLYVNGDSICFNRWAKLSRKYNLNIGDSVLCELECTSGVVTAVRVHFAK